jgi:hypothetical protein
MPDVPVAQGEIEVRGGVCCGSECHVVTPWV